MAYRWFFGGVGAIGVGLVVWPLTFLMVPVGVVLIVLGVVDLVLGRRRRASTTAVSRSN